MTPPPRIDCEIHGWIDRHCPNVACPKRLRDGRLCERVLVDMFDAHERGERWGLSRSHGNIGWALGVTEARIRQIEKVALIKLRARVNKEAA